MNLNIEVRPEDRRDRPQPAKALRRAPGRGAIFAAVAIVALLAGIMILRGGSPRPDPLTTGMEAKVASTPGAPRPSLYYLGDTAESHEVAGKAADVHDRLELLAMTVNGRIFPVTLGTKVLIIGSNATLWRVRVLQGEHAGETGWVSRSYVVPLDAPVDGE